MRTFPYLASGKLRIARQHQKADNSAMPSSLTELQRKKLQALIEADRTSAAAVGSQLGDKDYLRDFFKGRKNSLKPDAIVKLEQIFRLKVGSLMDKKFLTNEASSPLAREDEPPDSAAVPKLDQEAVRAIVEETIDLVKDLWGVEDVPPDERDAVTLLAIARASKRLALPPRPSSAPRKRPLKGEPSSP